MKNRHELKYVIDDSYQTIIENNLPMVMEMDKNLNDNKYYEVRSLYLDDIYNSCFFDNEDGIDLREKFRIRIYNGDCTRITFEIKRKDSGKTIKEQCPIDKDQVLKIIDGKSIDFYEDMNPLLKKLYIAQQTTCLQPKVIVEYDRIPYICEDGNVRITIDTNIRLSKDFNCFFDKRIICRPIMGKYTNLLEVKYDELLPDYIYRVLNFNNLQQTSFSKYYLCRKLGGY